MSNRLNFAIPEQYKDQANQLALLLGTDARDVNTFTEPQYTKDGVNYLVTSALVGGVFFEWWDNLPEPRNGCTDVAAAQLARDKCLFEFSDDSRAAFERMGLNEINVL